MASKKRRKRRTRIQEEGGISSNSTGDEGESNILDLSMSRSSGGDSEDRGEYMKDAHFTRETSAASTDVLDKDFNIDGAEYVMELGKLSPTKNKTRQRLDTGSSIDSSGGELGVSFARIEQFINEHQSPKSDNKKELV